MVASVYTFDDSKCVARPTHMYHPQSGSSLTLLQRLCSVGGFQSTLYTSRVTIKNNLSHLAFPKTLRSESYSLFLMQLPLLGTQRQNLILLPTGSTVLLRVLWASIKRKPNSKLLSKEPVMSSQNVNPESWLICDF